MPTKLKQNVTNTPGRVKREKQMKRDVASSIKNGAKVHHVHWGPCYPNPRRAIVTFVLYNHATKHCIERKKSREGLQIRRHTIFPLSKGWKRKKNIGLNDITILTNLELICKEMKGTYQVRKDNLKPLYKEAKIQSCEFQSFNIDYYADIQRMSTHLLCGAVNDGIRSSSVTLEVIWATTRYPLWECVFIVIFVGALMAWLFH